MLIALGSSWNCSRAERFVQSTEAILVSIKIVEMKVKENP